jgi:hypothetical protein
MLFTLLKEESCCEQKQETAVWVGPMSGVKDGGEQPDDDASLVPAIDEHQSTDERPNIPH